ncbi:MAG: hypothetical protein HY000_16665 [Planctomycetes bacterium]|nr:hypothetical protein [Planctomycetota bacterium]
MVEAIRSGYVESGEVHVEGGQRFLSFDYAEKTYGIRDDVLRALMRRGVAIPLLWRNSPNGHRIKFVAETFLNELAERRPLDHVFHDADGHWYTRKQTALRLGCAPATVNQYAKRAKRILGQPVCTRCGVLFKRGRLYFGPDVDQMVAYRESVRAGFHMSQRGLVIEDWAAVQVFSVTLSSLRNWRYWCAYLGRPAYYETVINQRGYVATAILVADIEAALLIRNAPQRNGTPLAASPSSA